MPRRPPGWGAPLRVWVRPASRTCPLPPGSQQVQPRGETIKRSASGSSAKEAARAAVEHNAASHSGAARRAGRPRQLPAHRGGNPLPGRVGGRGVGLETGLPGAELLSVGSAEHELEHERAPFALPRRAALGTKRARELRKRAAILPSPAQPRGAFVSAPREAVARQPQVGLLFIAFLRSICHGNWSESAASSHRSAAPGCRQREPRSREGGAPVPFQQGVSELTTITARPPPPSHVQDKCQTSGVSMGSQAPGAVGGP